MFILTHHPKGAEPVEGVTFLECDVAEAVHIGLDAGNGKNLEFDITQLTYPDSDIADIEIRLPAAHLAEAAHTAQAITTGTAEEPRATPAIGSCTTTGPCRSVATTFPWRMLGPVRSLTGPLLALGEP